MGSPLSWRRKWITSCRRSDVTAPGAPDWWPWKTTGDLVQAMFSNQDARVLARRTTTCTSALWDSTSDCLPQSSAPRMAHSGSF